MWLWVSLWADANIWDTLELELRLICRPHEKPTILPANFAVNLSCN